MAPGICAISAIQRPSVSCSVSTVKVTKATFAQTAVKDNPPSPRLRRGRGGGDGRAGTEVCRYWRSQTEFGNEGWGKHRTPNVESQIIRPPDLRLPTSTPPSDASSYQC